MRRILFAVLLSLSLRGACSFAQLRSPVVPLIDPNWRQVLEGEDRFTDAELRTWKGDVRLDYIYNVQDYGATGDGVTDDTAAVQAAENAADDAGGVIYFPPGTYLLDTDALGALANDAITISGDNITIQGAGANATTIQLGGTTTACSVFLATAVNRLTIRGIKFVGLGDTVADNSAIDIVGSALAHMDGFLIEDCEFHDFKALQWIEILAASGSYDIRHVTIRNCRFYSYDGDRFSDADGVASDFIGLDTNGPGGYVRYVTIADCWMDGDYMRKGIGLKDGVTDAVVQNCTILNCGDDLATDARESYGVMAGYGAGCQRITVADCRIIDCWTAGIYTVSASDLTFRNNHISGVEDTTDSTLNVGGIAAGNVENCLISGNTIVDCTHGIQAQPDGIDANIRIIGNEIRDTGQAARGINIREHGTWKNTGGVLISGNTIEDGDIEIYRSAGGARLHNVAIDNCSVVRGQIEVVTDVSGLSVTNNRVYNTATSASYRAFEFGGDTIGTITGNRAYGPGSGTASTYGFYFNTTLSGLSTFTNNTVQGFYYGMYAPYALSMSHSNQFIDVVDEVSNSVVGDMGRESPATIPNTVTNFAKAGLFVENAYPTTNANVKGWRCVTPVDGLGSTYAAATFTGDMAATETTITNVSDHSRFIPGVQLTLAGAGAAAATLTTEIVSWEITYNTLSGTFTDGEYVEETTNGGLGTIVSDNGSDTMYVNNIPYGMGTWAVGSTVKGHESGATAVITAIGLEVVDAAGTTVDDETLSLVTTTWEAVGPDFRNGSTSAGYLDIYEDSHNGNHRIRVQGPASTGDDIITLPTDTEVAKTGFLYNTVGVLTTTVPNAGTDVTADLEEETHASEHAVSAADTVFPADPGADRYLMWDDDPGALVWGSPAGSGDFMADGSVPMTGSLYITEAAAASADSAGLGQIWVKNATPNELWFTDDAGTDFQLGVSGAGDITGVWSDDTGDVSALTAAAGDTLDASNADSTVPWVVNATAAPTVEGQVVWESDADLLRIGDGASTLTVAMSGGAFHDGFSDFVANEHIDWTSDQGATNIHSGNIPDLSEIYEPAGVAVADITDASANGRSLISAANYAAMQGLLSIDDLITLSGVAEGSTHLATFTGSTITDNQTVKAALQLLETAVETKQAADADLSTYAGITPSADIQTFLGYANLAAIKGGLSVDDLVTLSGVADGSVHLGEFTGSTITDNQTVKAALQLLETAVETKQATVTEGSLTDSVIVSGDIKDGTIAGGDLASDIAITSTGTQNFGGAAGFEIPNGTNPTVDAAGEIAQDTDGANESGDVSIRAYDGTNTFLVARKLKTFRFTIVKPQDFADATRDLCPLWTNNSGMTFTITEIRAWSPADDTTVTLEIVTATNFSSPATLDALEIAKDGTSVYTCTETTITDATVAHDEIITADFDDTDDPGWVMIEITGWFNAAVD